MKSSVISRGQFVSSVNLFPFIGRGYGSSKVELITQNRWNSKIRVFCQITSSRRSQTTNRNLSFYRVVGVSQS